ncbi:MAG TPA: isoprenylcysteine carboxylmethyltransferase family protein [Candidatus Deferrimicrobium sp.]|nr:isoprenylcysteine carboxylmethyltransferase family protein [Candidatus Deferrimicrobium sp.]
MKIIEVLDDMKSRRQTVFNICFFLVMAVMIADKIYKQYVGTGLTYIDVSFTIQNIVLLTVILIRRPHRGVDSSVFNQAVALAAFCSGIAFMGQQTVQNSLLTAVSTGIIIIANILGITTLLALGRSFGVLIAVREIKTSGLYSFVRHPMYGTDILLRIGFIVSHFNPLTAFVFVVSTGCYVYRAVLEEKFLSREEAYSLYMKKVRYRFIPGFF